MAIILREKSVSTDGIITEQQNLLSGTLSSLTNLQVDANFSQLNKAIKDSELPEHIRVGAIVRKEKVIIPRSDFIFEKDDLVVFLAKREHLKEVEKIFSVASA